MEEKTAETASCQKSLPATQDPGWNDPPKWAFTAKPDSSTPVKRLLNKRVAFPLNFQPSLSSGGTLPGVPPPLDCTTNLTTTPHAPLTAPSNFEKGQEELEIDAKKSLKETVERLELVLNKFVPEANRADELRKRLEMMRSMWEEGKLNGSVCNKVCKISEALENEDFVTADKLHVTLMMEHASLCSSWIPCVRQLIQRVKETRSTSEEAQQNASYFVPSS